MAISPLGRAQDPLSVQSQTSPADGEGGGFGEALRELLSSVDEATGSANTAVASMLDGTGDVHEAMIALHRAETSLQLTVQIRNKLVAAYQDVMRMPI